MTPSDIAPTRLSQQQIDELEREQPVADILPLTPLQHGLLYHASVAHSCGDDVYAVQLDVTLTGRLDQYRLRDAVRTVVARHPNLAARFHQHFDQPLQMIPADPAVPWRYLELDSGAVDFDEQVAEVCAAERAAVCDLAGQAAYRAVLIRVAADQHRFVLTNHHIVLDGWSLPILQGEIFASYYGQRLPAAVPYRRFVTWLATRDRDAARSAWRRVFVGFDAPTLVGPPDLSGPGRRAVASVRLPEQTTHAVSELARSHHTTVNTVLQASWAQLLCWLTGQHDVAFGAVVSGRPAEVPGADSMIGLLINTVPVRATVTAATTTAELLHQLRNARNDTVEHEHLALREIHRATGQGRLFDSVFVYENYPTDGAALSGADGLVVTELTNRDYYHYPLAIQAVPGRELELRVQYRADVFHAADIAAMTERFQQVLVAMTADPTGPLSSMDLPEGGKHRALVTQPISAPEHRDTAADYRAPTTLVEQIMAGIYTQILGLDHIGINESFFDLGGDSITAMQAITAINSALDTHLALSTLINTPTIKNLSQQIGGHANTAKAPIPTATNDP